MKRCGVFTLSDHQFCNSRLKFGGVSVVVVWFGCFFYSLMKMTKAYSVQSVKSSFRAKGKKRQDLLRDLHGYMKAANYT